MTKFIIKMSAVLAIVAWACAAPVLAGPVVPTTYGIGDGMMTVPTQLKFDSLDGLQWEIMDSGGGPLELYYSPNAGPLEKILNGADFAAGEQFTLIEHIHVNQGPAWTDWHQQFVSSSFIWTGNPVLSLDDSGDAFMGIISPDGTQVDFYFPSPLPPCTLITINKQFIYTGASEPPDGIVIDQWPTVPEPGTIVLLAGGLLGLLCYAWRRRKG